MMCLLFDPPGLLGSRRPGLRLSCRRFNEEACLPLLAAELIDVLGGGLCAWEVILVDDGSTDGTAKVMQGLCASHPEFRSIILPHRGGQSAALVAGFRAVRYGITVAIDADLQNDPRDIPRLLEHMGEYDCVSGRRQNRRDGWLRGMQSRVANRVRGLILGDGVTDTGCTLKAYRTSLLRQAPLFRGMHRFLPALLLMQGARVLEIPVNHRPRAAGTSKVRLCKRSVEATVDLLGVWWLKSRALTQSGERGLPFVERSGEMSVDDAFLSRSDRAT